MKPFATVIASIVLMGTAFSASAATHAEQAAQLCKSEALEQLGSPEQPVRVRFKSVSGPRKAPVVTLKVFPAGGDSYRAICEADPRAGEVRSLTVIQ